MITFGFDGNGLSCGSFGRPIQVVDSIDLDSDWWRHTRRRVVCISDMNDETAPQIRVVVRAMIRKRNGD